MTDRAARPQTSLRLQRVFDVPREQVFAAWTDPDKLKRWFGPEGHSARRVEVDLRVGGRYRLEMRGAQGDKYVISGTYQDVQPPERLVYTWAMGEETGEGGETLVTLEFAESDGRTQVTLTHERFPDSLVRDQHEEGWALSLERLDAFLE